MLPKWMLGDKLEVIAVGHLRDSDGLIRIFTVRTEKGEADIKYTSKEQRAR